jgi:hypothetical protein
MNEGSDFIFVHYCTITCTALGLVMYMPYYKCIHQKPFLWYAEEMGLCAFTFVRDYYQDIILPLTAWKLMPNANTLELFCEKN